LISSKRTHKIYLIKLLIVCVIYINLILSKPLMQEGSIDETAGISRFKNYFFLHYIHIIIKSPYSMCTGKLCTRKFCALRRKSVHKQKHVH